MRIKSVNLREYPLKSPNVSSVIKKLLFSLCRCSTILIKTFTDPSRIILWLKVLMFLNFIFSQIQKKKTVVFTLSDGRWNLKSINF